MRPPDPPRQVSRTPTKKSSMTPMNELQIALALALKAAQDAFAAAEESRRAREEFLARMSHEMRTPLNTVIGLSRVLENNRAGNQRPEDLDLLGRVRAGGERLLRFVENVLEHSDMERGERSFELRDTNVVEIVSRVVQDYRTKAASKGLRMIAVLPEAAAPVRLDPVRFEHVVRHLLDNAVKFTVSGRVRVRLVLSDLAPARLVVLDTGIGIPADRLAKIFEPFEQADGSSRRAHEGAGLGLALARQLCVGMGCELSVESEVGKGSRFTVRFPTTN